MPQPLAPCPAPSDFCLQYDSNCHFIDTLRKQSHKIQQMLQHCDHLKAESASKDKLIAQLRRKQNEHKADRLKMEELIRDQYMQRMAMAEHKCREVQARVVDLENENQLLRARLLEQSDGAYLKYLQQAHEQELARLTADKEALARTVQKWQQKYNNCKQQCLFLQLQLQQGRQLSQQLQLTLSQAHLSTQLLLQQHSHQLHQLHTQISTLKHALTIKQAEMIRLGDELQVRQGEMVRQVQLYEADMRGVVERAVRAEGEARGWRDRCGELEGLVGYVEGVRRGWPGRDGRPGRARVDGGKERADGGKEGDEENEEVKEKTMKVLINSVSDKTLHQRNRHT